MSGLTVSVSKSTDHHFSKEPAASVLLVEGMGVEGDAHAGATVQHLSRVRADPSQPNLRQVHLIQAELFDDLAQEGFRVGPGDLGENITTWGIDLLALPVGALLRIGPHAVVEVTGLRNPCRQIDRFRTGLLKAVVSRNEAGDVERRAGIMGIVVRGGEIKPDNVVGVDLPPGPHRALERV
ncbi:MOSC domain-containing protein [uncultured Arthrobacter sp.]|uniref:MOSC domain-containing protein n=1 Tax=uncultured Arthrobacter sp. TaxID=114050 RepID=UPI00261EAB03|nr:MOSC domain-containing protein [uncultured Arthrobacter sp.]